MHGPQMMSTKQASHLHLILTHIKCSPALRAGVADSTKIPNFDFVVVELMDAVSGHMHGPV